MEMYASVYRSILFPLWEGVRGRPTLQRLHYLERTQFCSPDELDALQVGKLRRLLGHAWEHVPGYRRRMEEAGLDPARLLHVDDMARLPVLTREQVQGDAASFVARAAAGAGKPRLLTKSTSGTTGMPFRFSYSFDSEVWRQAVKLRAYGWAGYTPGLRTVHYWGPAAVPPSRLKSWKIQLDRALRRELYLDCARQGEGDLRAAVDTLRRLQPRVLIGFTQATAQLARFVLLRDLRDWPAMHVLCGAERLFPADRQVLEQAFGEPGSVFETYGCREFMLIASECEAQHGLHTSAESLLVEVVDEQGRPVPAGTMGRVAITDLHNYGMPLIRYLTGDLAIARAPDDRCPCGRGLPRLSSLEGRQADLLRGRDGRRIPGIVFNSVIAGLGGKVLQFQALQRRDDVVELRLVPGPEFDPAIVPGIRSRLQPYLADLHLVISVVDTIPAMASGKRRHVIVEDSQTPL